MNSDKQHQSLVIGLNAVVLAVTDDQPRVLTVGPRTAVESSGLGGALDGGYTTDYRALPFGPFDAEHDRTLELCLRDRVRDQAGIEFGFVEQLYTFADKGRDPRELAGGSRVMSVAYLALVRERQIARSDDASWEDVYSYLPWEDWRQGRPDILVDIGDLLVDWAGGSADKRERVDICFGLGDAAWDAYRVLQRYELLYEAGLVDEYRFDRGGAPEREGSGKTRARLGTPMAFDHRRILATGLSRVRGKLQYRPVAFELIPDPFTLLELQNAVEAISGLKSHKQNFRRLVEKSGLVERTGRRRTKTGGRPAELFRFRRAVLRERRAQGVTTLAPPSRRR